MTKPLTKTEMALLLFEVAPETKIAFPMNEREEVYFFNSIGILTYSEMNGHDRHETKDALSIFMDYYDDNDWPIMDIEIGTTISDHRKALADYYKGKRKNEKIVQ